MWTNLKVPGVRHFKRSLGVVNSLNVNTTLGGNDIYVDSKVKGCNNTQENQIDFHQTNSNFPNNHKVVAKATPRKL